MAAIREELNQEYQAQTGLAKQSSKMKPPINYPAEGLSLCFRCDQHLVGNVFGSHSDTEERAECSLAGSATVEAEDELIEVGLQML